MKYVERPGKPVFRHGQRIEMVELVPIGQKQRRKSFKAEFVMIPMSWIEALRHTKNRHAYELAFALLAERHKRKHVGGEVIISSETVPGMPRMARWRATKKLVQLSLIEVDRVADHAAPRVLAFNIQSDTPKRSK
jgi:hypothetical protein